MRLSAGARVEVLVSAREDRRGCDLCGFGCRLGLSAGDDASALRDDLDRAEGENSVLLEENVGILTLDTELATCEPMRRTLLPVRTLDPDVEVALDVVRVRLMREEVLLVVIVAGAADAVD